MLGLGEIRLALMLAAAAPVGANVAIYAQLYGSDHSYACKAVVRSTLLSLVTLPLITLAGNIIL